MFTDMHFVRKMSTRMKDEPKVINIIEGNYVYKHNKTNKMELKYQYK